MCLKYHCNLEEYLRVYRLSIKKVKIDLKILQIFISHTKIILHGQIRNTTPFHTHIHTHQLAFIFYNRIWLRQDIRYIQDFQADDPIRLSIDTDPLGSDGRENTTSKKPNSFPLTIGRRLQQGPYTGTGDMHKM